MDTKLEHLTKYELLTVLDIISLCLSGYDGALSTILKTIGELVPVDGLVALVAATNPTGQFKEIVKVAWNTFPTEWVANYARKGYTRCDPVFRTHFRSYGPQIWSCTFARATSSPEVDFVEDAIDHGLHEGLTLGLPDAKLHLASLFSFRGRAITEHPRHLSVLRYLIPHLHTALFPDGDASRGDDAGLSPREHEVLQWAKVGKTNWEISQILRISERTVKFHVQNAMGKLNATSRTHAVAIAMSRGLIEL